MFIESNYEAVAVTLLVLTFMWLLTRLLRSFANYYVSEGQMPIYIPLSSSPDSGHHWAKGGIIFPLHCSICQLLLLAPAGEDCIGLICTDCGLSTCDQRNCVRTAQKQHHCKDIALHRPNQEKQLNSNKHYHHWIQGNLPLLANCDVCEHPCAESPEDSLEDLKCCWCHRTIHKDCLQRLSNICDFGSFQSVIVPPSCVTAQPARSVIHPRRWKITEVSSVEKTMTTKKWRPLIVIGNTKAGNNDGEVFLNTFRGQLNPAQVIDLNSYNVEDGLHWCNLIKNQCIVLIAGGDGTIGWVLNTIDQMNLPIKPLVALLPLGTGNDLARSLGYGSHSDSHQADSIIEQIQLKTQETSLDRWKVTIFPIKKSKNTLVKTTIPSKTIFMQNYLSIGVDALITYNFHKTRENQTLPFSGRLFNKLLYFIYGTKDVLERECMDLDQILDLYLDGRKINLPSIESVVILNIPCWGAGVKPWELGTKHVDYNKPSFNDGQLEVFCIYSSFHIAQMQVGLSEPHRIGQAKDVRIVLKGKTPMQTDGEPWLQGPTEIVIQHHNQVPILKVIED